MKIKPVFPSDEGFLLLKLINITNIILCLLLLRPIIIMINTDYYCYYYRECKILIDFYIKVCFLCQSRHVAL